MSEALSTPPAPGEQRKFHENPIAWAGDKMNSERWSTAKKIAIVTGIALLLAVAI